MPATCLFLLSDNASAVARKIRRFSDLEIKRSRDLRSGMTYTSAARALLAFKCYYTLSLPRFVSVTVEIGTNHLPICTARLEDRVVVPTRHPP
jgi:hypothetical protein